jgi:UDP-N-acetylglucosamine 4,6-dehydratase
VKRATWLITGGTGAFGRAFTRYLLANEEPASVRILARKENGLAEMRASFNDPRLRFLVGDVRDRERMIRACQGVDYVAHAAAMKRIEMCEADPDEAVASNIMGTQNVAAACIQAGVKKAVFLSTDKAAAPSTLYGATKLVAERLWIQSNVYAAGTNTKLSATRYGNVANSTGSVIPIWKQQALHGGPITITNPDATRFLMTLDDAVGLVMKAFTRMNGGEVYVPRMGAVSVGTLTRAVAPNVQWQVIGMRPGEKLHETLISPDEAHQARDDGDCYVLEPLLPSWRPEGFKGVRESAHFSMTSDKARELTMSELEGMV